ncbi:hypothetical protein [Ralstonia sp. NFACC01]|uniref:hypothetical protein n=1 Tax=Ralstonia sp. NFACC01 TaxID=1566294 RepID=UPI0008EAA09C|nr:hypothetical protein [Ralstonia sp. NFACC01]SFQ21727.1 hypothetical protein SAMN03159417_04650 [Ralstonia sp. NFACC01]
MHDAFHIDPATGDIRFADIRITPQTTADALPSRFAVGPVRSVSVEGKDVPCQFATVAALDDTTPVTVSLRFEADALVSVFVELAQPVSYDDIGVVEERHRRWIASKLGKDPGGLTRYLWGSAGVAQDKSGGVHIFLHNRNNTWGR